MRGYSRTALRRLRELEESTIAYLSNSQDKLVINKLMDYPVLRSLWLYHPTNYPAAAWAAIIIFPVGLTVWLIGRARLRNLRSEVNRIAAVSVQLEDIIQNPVESNY